MNHGTCNRCGAAVVWAETSRGGRIPLNAVPHPLGSVYLDGRGRVGSDDPHARPDTGLTYMKHFLTCPVNDE